MTYIMLTLILHELDKLGYDIKKLKIIDFDIDIFNNYVTFEYPDEPDSREGGRTMWKVDLINRRVCHKDHSVGSFWTEWEDI